MPDPRTVQTPLLALLALLALAALLPAARGQCLEERRLVLGPGDHGLLGSSLARSGGTLAVCAPAADAPSLARAGAVHVYVLQGDAWIHEAKITAGDPDAQQAFASSVALGGDTLVVGAPYDDDAAFDAGAVYVFVRQAGVWSQQAKLFAADADADDHFGASVAVHGDTLAIGATEADLPGIFEPGGVYVFERQGASWSQQARLSTTTADFYHHLGVAVALEGDTLAASVTNQEDLFGGAGAVFVYTRSAGVWSERTRLVATPQAFGQQLGWALALEGDTLLAGAPTRFVDTYAQAGAAYVFRGAGASWTQEAELFAETPVLQARFGSAVALEGDAALVGAPGPYFASAVVGSVRRFERAGTVWTAGETRSASDGGAPDRFGSAVVLHGARSVVGADQTGAPLTTGYPREGALYAFGPCALVAASCFGSAALCPCGNAGQPDRGCDNPQATGGVRLDAAFVARDGAGGGSATFAGEGFPPAAAPGVTLIRSPAAQGVPQVFGDGLLCIATPVVRVRAGLASAGTVELSAPHAAGPGAFHYQLWYRSAPASFCDPLAAFNLSNMLSIAW